MKEWDLPTWHRSAKREYQTDRDRIGLALWRVMLVAVHIATILAELRSIDVPSCNFAASASKNPDIAAGHGASMMRDPAWNRRVFGVIS